MLRNVGRDDSKTAADPSSPRAGIPIVFTFSPFPFSTLLPDQQTPDGTWRADKNGLRLSLSDRVIVARYLTPERGTHFQGALVTSIERSRGSKKKATARRAKSRDSYSRHTSRGIHRATVRLVGRAHRAARRKMRGRAPSARRSGTPYLGTRTPPIRTATLRAFAPVSISRSRLLFFSPLFLFPSVSLPSIIDTSVSLAISSLALERLSPKTFSP